MTLKSDWFSLPPAPVVYTSLPDLQGTPSCQRGTNRQGRVNMAHLTLMELSTDPENSRPLEMARQTTLPSCRVRACMQRMCSMFQTCSTRGRLKKHSSLYNYNICHATADTSRHKLQYFH